MLHRVTFRPDPLSDPGSCSASNRWWLALWVTLSTVVHGSLGLALPSGQSPAPRAVRGTTEVFDIDPPSPSPPPPPPPPPPVPPDPPPAAPPTQQRSPGPSPSPSPPPQQAAAVLTASDDVGPLDFTDQFVTGQATAFAGGATSSRGTNSRRLASSAAAASAAPSAPGVGSSRDHSRRPSVVGGFAWSCPFPPAADAAGIDLAVVQLKIRVSARGTLDGAAVMADPGHGFGAAARRCAAGKRFLPALDRSGAAVAGELVVRVRFTR